MGAAIGLLGAMVMIALAIAQLVVGFMGIEHELNAVWAWAAVAVFFIFRFILPISIGAFFGAMNVLGWHWALALIFALPGLLFIIPGFIASIFDAMKRASA